MRVLTIFVRHGTEKYASAERDLADRLRTQLPAVRRDTVIVDTAVTVNAHAADAGQVIIAGDNSAWEFSGFDSGLAFVGDNLFNYDLVNLTTSAFAQLYVGYLDCFRPEVLSAVANRSVCLGHIDCYNQPIEVAGCRSQHWLRTACIFLPPTELRILGSLVSTRDRNEWFSGDPSAPFRADAPLSDEYKRLITDWLVGGDIGQGVKWHSRIVVDDRNLREFEKKATAILNEHLLGIRLRAVGCRLIDVSWLSGLLTHRRPESIQWNTPWWRQLAERDRAPVRVTTA